MMELERGRSFTNAPYLLKLVKLVALLTGPPDGERIAETHPQESPPEGESSQ